MNQVLCDTSFMVSLYAVKDPLRDEGLEVYEELKRSGRRLVTTWMAVSETIALLRYRYGYREAMAFVHSLRGWEVREIDPDQYQRALGLWEARAKEHPLSLTDVVLYVLATTEDPPMPVVTFDQDFRRLGVATIPVG